MIALHHVQVACPPGGEDDARRFYADGLGLTEVEKPADLRRPRRRLVPRVRRLGAVAAELHVGVEEPFAACPQGPPGVRRRRPRRRRGRRSARPGSTSTSGERDTFAGYLRFHTHDGAGNRVEVLQVRPADAS